jgi:hypothetical protein
MDYEEFEERMGSTEAQSARITGLAPAFRHPKIFVLILPGRSSYHRAIERLNV